MRMKKEKEKSELEWRKYWKEKAEKLQKENLMLKHKLKLAQMELKILHWETVVKQEKPPIIIYWKWVWEIKQDLINHRAKKKSDLF